MPLTEAPSADPPAFERIGLVWLIAALVLTLGLFAPYWYALRAWEVHRLVGMQPRLTVLTVVLVIGSMIEYAAILHGIVTYAPQVHPLLEEGLFYGNTVLMLFTTLALRPHVGAPERRPRFLMSLFLGIFYLEWFLARDPSARRTPAGLRGVATATAVLVLAGGSEFGLQQWTEHQRQVSYEASQAAHAALSAGRVKDAEPHIARALTAYPANDNAILLRAWAHRETGHLAEARADVLAAIDLVAPRWYTNDVPARDDARRRLADAYRQLGFIEYTIAAKRGATRPGDYDAARAAYERSLQYEPDETTAEDLRRLPGADPDFEP